MRQPLRTDFFLAVFSIRSILFPFGVLPELVAPNSGPVVPSLETDGLACDIEIDTGFVCKMYNSRVSYKLKA